jgi:transglutaminase-like putative cysteine protease
MKHLLKFLSVLIFALGTGCANNHLIKNNEYLNEVERAYAERTQLAAKRGKELFNILNEDLSLEQKEAMKFLYAYMPLSDLADYDGRFFLANAEIALRTRTEARWGKDIPEEIFLHYVLPYRVNNENLDSFRIAYYDELLERVKGMELKDAALEINHWCHEKVSYQAADIRTSAPMSTILSARGRCGEESTFTVAALRTAGIPARQVYTPRWAHSDDNHAWVEIWSGGEWFYMGACEPEAVLDKGWFTEPARRAMLVHTKSFGAALGNENAINIEKSFTDVNNLSKYAVTKRIFVKVLDNMGNPSKDALVEYKLYNYAEFYSLASVPTDPNGISSFETGLGDLLIWASKNNDFDYKKISVSLTDTLILTLGKKPENNLTLDIDLDVPVVRTPFKAISTDKAELNSKRVSQETIIQKKYIDTWITNKESSSIASRLNLDSSKVIDIFSKSMGNYNEIKKFILNTPDSLRFLAISLLEVISEKDLRDTKEEVLTDHLLNSNSILFKNKSINENIYLNYVLNPRVANEIIRPWRGFFVKNLPRDILDNGSQDPLLVENYLNSNIIIASDDNYYKTPITPRGVYELGVSDEESRAICFVAICRTLGVPSRLEPGRNTPQFFKNNLWNDVYFKDQDQPINIKGYIKLTSSDTKPVPEYYIHFTLARFENGRYNTLEYDYNRKISDFKEEIPLPPGDYMLVTGNRLNNSKILSRISFFKLSENERKSVNINLRKDITENKMLGKINLNNILELIPDKNSKLCRGNDKGLVIIWIEPDKEPTKHIFNDLPLLKSELDEWGGDFIFLSTSQQDKNTFDPENLKGLPDLTHFSTDNNLEVLKKSIELSEPADIRFPYVVMTDKNGNIVFTSSGYRIGIGEQLLKNTR